MRSCRSCCNRAGWRWRTRRCRTGKGRARRGRVSARCGGPGCAGLDVRGARPAADGRARAWFLPSAASLVCVRGAWEVAGSALVHQQFVRRLCPAPLRPLNSVSSSSGYSGGLRVPCDLAQSCTWRLRSERAAPRKGPGPGPPQVASGRAALSRQKAGQHLSARLLQVCLWCSCWLRPFVPTRSSRAPHVASTVASQRQAQ